MTLDAASDARIELIVNSPGGPLDAASAVLDTIDLVRGPVDTMRTDPHTVDPSGGNRRVAQRHELAESRMRGNAHVRFGSAGRGNGCFERTTPRPGPILTSR
jgi:hypothetical protein